MSPNAPVSRVNSLFDNWYGALVRYATRFTGRIEIAEELVQEAFYLLYRELAAGKLIESDRAWTFAVVRRQIIRQFCARAPREVSFESPEFREISVSLTAGSSESAADLAQHFNVLSKREEEVLRLCMESLKYREIAAALEISPNSVATLHRRAIQKLRKLLAQPVQSNASKAKGKRGETIEHVAVTP
jgi:RNA polymerase sigma-70 factor (ECF subfamily)